MHPVIREVWTLIHGDEWEHSPQRALDASRALYDAHRYLAVGGSFMAAFSAANELSLRFAGPRVKSALLADYPEEIFEPLGSRRRAETAIRDALDLLTGMAELADRPGDYSFEPRLQRLASDYKGTAVYVYSYCARRLYGEILDAADPDRRTERIEELRRVLTEATEPED